MLWAIVYVLAFFLLVALVVALARPGTARWEHQRRAGRVARARRSADRARRLRGARRLRRRLSILDDDAAPTRSPRPGNGGRSTATRDRFAAAGRRAVEGARRVLPRRARPAAEQDGAADLAPASVGRRATRRARRTATRIAHAVHRHPQVAPAADRAQLADDTAGQPEG